MVERILVTGATGKTGAALVRKLVNKHAEVRAASRNPVGPGGVRFDWRDPATHAPALNGVTAVYLVAPTDTTAQLAVMRPFLERALEANVDRFVLLSACALERGGPLMGAVDAWLGAHARRWTVLRPSWFMQNFVTQHLPTIRESGAIYTAAADGRVPFIDAYDIAAVAAHALTDPGFQHGRAPILTGPEALTYDDAARMISEIAGRPVRHVRLTAAELAGRFMNFGLPADYAALLANMDERIAQGLEARITDEVASITGQTPARLADVLKRHKHLFECALTPSVG